MSEFGDIVIDGKPFRVNLPSYSTRDIVDFAPRATVPGNSYVMADLSLYQPLVQTDWQHGIGFHWYSDASGYMRTVGNIDTRHDGLVMMFTEPEESDTNNNAKTGGTVFNGSWYTWGAAGLRKYSGGSWTSIYSASAVNYALNVGDYLLFCPDGGRIQKMNTSDVVTNAGLDANASDFKWLIVHNGFIYAGKDGTNRIHYTDKVDASDLEGTTSDPGAIYCGVGNIPTVGAIVYSGSLYVSRQDGMWQIGEDNIARRVLDYSDAISANNFRDMTSLNGYVYFPIRDKIIQWNGVRVADITPSRITDEFPYITYSSFKNFMTNDKFMLCTGRTTETVYTESLLAWDGVGWHRLTDMVSSSTAFCTMLEYDQQNNYLWYHVDDTADKTYFIRLNNNSYPYANFPTSGQHSLITSRNDMGFRRINKSMTSMFVEARNVNANRYIDVYYSIDGETDIYWDRIKSNGVTELNYPGGFPTVEFSNIVFRFDFVTDSASQSPVLESYTINFIMRPMTRVGYTFDVVAATAFEMEGRQDERTSAEIFKDLMDIRNSTAPVRFIGLYGEEVLGYLTSVRSIPTYRTLSMEDDGQNYIELVINCSFVEMESIDAYARKEEG